jgi:hypothetical protein
VAVLQLGYSSRDVLMSADQAQHLLSHRVEIIQLPACPQLLNSIGSQRLAANSPVATLDFLNDDDCLFPFENPIPHEPEKWVPHLYPPLFGAAFFSIK